MTNPMKRYVNIRPMLKNIPDDNALKGFFASLAMYPMAATLAANVQGAIAVERPRKNAETNGMLDCWASWSMNSIIGVSPDML
jgi:hypothetical protein